MVSVTGADWDARHAARQIYADETAVSLEGRTGRVAVRGRGRRKVDYTRRTRV